MLLLLPIFTFASLYWHSKIIPCKRNVSVHK